ncbi:peptidase domain-containing ABC transporter [Thalassoporum mexicanum]|uniref:peptidase domain-containing ABC transporter n=1 Tax=Thalassoporum mexicanum TaxID=3457544 RepID=UPI0002FF292B|nr:peptidase domain-containing ABC transporter [Pseudanabaena sp. PCC 7367]
MTNTKLPLREFLSQHALFSQLEPNSLDRLAQHIHPLRYRMGQAILVRSLMPSHVYVIYSGQARILGQPPNSNVPETLQLLEPGDLTGWLSLIRQVSCETAIATTDTACLAIPAKVFSGLLKQSAEFTQAITRQIPLVEIYDILGTELERRPDLSHISLKQLSSYALEHSVVQYASRSKVALSQLDPNLTWFYSGGSVINFKPGEVLEPNDPRESIQIKQPGNARLIGINPQVWLQIDLSQMFDVDVETANQEEPEDELADVPYAPDYPETSETVAITTVTNSPRFEFIPGKGPINGTLACFQMLAKYWQMPPRRDVLRRAIANQFDRNGSIPLQYCGALAELMGLKSQLVHLPTQNINRIRVPAMIAWQDSGAIIHEVGNNNLTLAIPEQGIVTYTIAEMIAAWGEEGQVLLLQASKHTPQQRFGLKWFIPSIIRHRRVLIEVLIASFFVQLFGLANPLVTQIIIDKVIIQNGVETLNFLGSFVIVVAVFEAIISAIRTNLFVDTTNRIDLNLGAEVIDHLLRLPLRYYERRPVGELSNRVNELENIRQFLTGTALTVVLDAIFSVIYIVVMLFYSVLLTGIALSTVPLFALLTLIVAPLIRQQLRTKAERNAETQAYFVEVIAGIQTVKAQNIELLSRWRWQKHYAKYVSAGFKSVLTSTAAGSMSNFLNHLSSLLLLWVGAYLVIRQELTLGQLIAFRIIASYTTSPLLRLIQLWQNFQETALSLERLSDILDTPQEQDEIEQQNIPMPYIKGQIVYENVTFSFNETDQPQLTNLDLEILTGAFVGIVGQSGAGKSTLAKLLPRLYELNSGRILIDQYDIAKVELYSLRTQIGIILQETMLFDGTVQENIMLSNPDVQPETVVEAAQIACAHDFIMTLPAGYNTRVGERGANLSGGQRQRIAIARTILQNPRLLIFDEATSALDYQTERQVCENIRHTFQDRTVLFITHRLPTIQNADQILMLEAGRLIEQGTHPELMQSQGSYYCLYQQQSAQM